MTYATLDQLSDRYGAPALITLTDRAAVPTGVIDQGVIARVLADTDAVIDGYLEKRYALPVTDVPPVLITLGLAIAIYKLHVFQPDQKIEEEYKEAMRMLREIADGRITLTIAGKAAEGSGGSGARITDRARPLTQKNLTGFI
jgi:phage gp36-like protein